MSRPGLSAIVLAGGRSSRFGRDKLAEPIGGRPLLHHAIDAVRPYATEVLVVVAPDAAPAVPPGVVLVRDAAPFKGPLAGLLAGLGAAREDVALVIGGDMPELAPAVVGLLLADLDRDTVNAVILEHAGRGRPLPMALRRQPALAMSARLMAAGERRLGALGDALVATIVAEETWLALDPARRTVHDIDTPDDLP